MCIRDREYLVRVDKALTEGFVEHMRRGVHLNELQLTTRPCKLVIRDKTSFYITLTQGLNRQIRRMCEALGYHVVSLKRLRVMNIRLGGLKSGSWRNVTPEELKTLSGMLKKDSSATDSYTHLSGRACADCVPHCALVLAAALLLYQQTHLSAVTLYDPDRDTPGRPSRTWNTD